MDETTGDAGDEEAVVDLEFDGVLKFLVGGFEHLVETFGLGDGSWETV